MENTKRLFRIKEVTTGQYYTGKTGQYSDHGKFYTLKTLKLAWKNVVRHQENAGYHIFEELKVESIRKFKTNKIDEI